MINQKLSLHIGSRCFSAFVAGSVIDLLLAAMLSTAVGQENSTENRVVFSNSVFAMRQIRHERNTSWLISNPENGNFLNALELPEIPRTTAVAASNLVEFTISFKLRNQAKFDQKVADGESISQGDLDENYLPSRMEYGRVLEWLRKNRVRILTTNSSRISIMAESTVSNVESLLKVGMVNLSMKGTNYFTATNPPSLPSSIAAPVSGIQGLQPFIKPLNHSNLLPGSSPSANNRWVKQVLASYRIDGQPYKGNNQTIAILTDALPDSQDVRAFWNSNQIAFFPDKLVLLDAAPPGKQLPSNAVEATLDAEWAGAVASGSKVRVYAVGNFSWARIANGLHTIYVNALTNPTLRVVSMSFGGGEMDVHQDEIENVKNELGFLVLQKVSIFVSSGDNGDTPVRPYPYDTTPIVQVEFPASSPFVTAVGGTSFQIVDGTNVEEIAWSGSGGGISQIFPAAKWQRGLGIDPANSKRLVPDVSMVADPIVNVVYRGAIVQRGGTSLGAPVWAGFCAILNEARNKNGLDPLDHFNARIYPTLGQAAMSDIIKGSNGTYAAGSGYDMISGVGVPNLPLLVSLLGAQ
jgi:kumamolisin